MGFASRNAGSPCFETAGVHVEGGAEERVPDEDEAPGRKDAPGTGFVAASQRGVPDGAEAQHGTQQERLGGQEAAEASRGNVRLESSRPYQGYQRIHVTE